MPFCIPHADVPLTIVDMLDIKFIGPSLEAGPLPTVFYFALSADDSLHVDPYHQPALILSSEVRVFSVTLPGHDTLPPTEAIGFWTNEVVEKFTTKVAAYINELFEKKIVLPEKMGVMGLSRGVYIAAHVAAKIPQIRYLLGFASMTRLLDTKLTSLADKLYDRTIRCYIGNHDVRVGTDQCFEFIATLAKTAYQHQLKSSPIELIIGPSIGRHGHGTSPEVFRHGSEWLRSKVQNG